MDENARKISEGFGELGRGTGAIIIALAFEIMIFLELPLRLPSSEVSESAC